MYLWVSPRGWYLCAATYRPTCDMGRGCSRRSKTSSSGCHGPAFSCGPMRTFPCDWSSSVMHTFSSSAFGFSFLGYTSGLSGPRDRKFHTPGAPGSSFWQFHSHFLNHGQFHCSSILIFSTTGSFIAVLFSFLSFLNHGQFHSSTCTTGSRAQSHRQTAKVAVGFLLYPRVRRYWYRPALRSIHPCKLAPSKLRKQNSRTTWTAPPKTPTKPQPSNLRVSE